MGCNPLFPAGKAQVLLSGGFEVDLAFLNAQGFCHHLAHGGDVGCQLGLLGNDRGVDVGDGISGTGDPLSHGLEQQNAGDPLVGWIRIGEEMADVSQGGGALTDDCAAVEALGMKVHLTQGDEENIKVTTPLDLVVAEAILERRQRL